METKDGFGGVGVVMSRVPPLETGQYLTATERQRWSSRVVQNFASGSQ